MSILLLTRPQPPGPFAPGLRAELPGEAMWEEAAAATEADVLVCTLPLTPATHGLLDRETLQKLPRGASVINVARGGHLVEPDLLALLDNGHLAGATLDVQAVEPLAPESPLWDHPRVTLTPHIAAQASVASVVSVVTQFADNWKRFRAGQSLHNLIDRRRGY